VQLPRLYAILDASCFADTSALLIAAEELVSGGCTLIQYRNKSGKARIMLEQARELRRCLVIDSPFSQNQREGERPSLVRHPTSENSTQDQNLHPKIADGTILGWGTQHTRSQSPHPFDSLRSLRAGSVAENATRMGHPRSCDSIRLIMNDRADLCLAAEFDGVHLGQDDLSPESVRKIIGPNRWLGVSTHKPEQVGEADQTSADYIAIGPVFATSSKVNPDPVVGLEGVRRARELTGKPLVAIGGIMRANALSVIDAGADSVAVISDLLRDPGKSAEEFRRILG
jgi:thiamine-phosphate pyrophosphorylase